MRYLVPGGDLFAGSGVPPSEITVEVEIVETSGGVEWTESLASNPLIEL